MASTCADVIRRSSLIKVFTLWMYSSVRYSDVVRYTCSSCFRAFYPPIYLSLIPDACSILRQHPATDLRWFGSLCPHKAHCDMLFLDCALTEWSVHTLDFVAPCHSTERWDAARSFLLVVPRVRTSLLFLCKDFKLASTLSFALV